MIESRRCPECGAEIIFMYETPARCYRIEDGTLRRDDNNQTDDPELNPYCSYDREHVLDQPCRDPNDLWQWVDDVFMYFIDRGIYEV
jgi:hypothetical protein